MKYDITYCDIKDLQAFAGNPRKIEPDEMEKLRRSLREFGFVDPVVARTEDKLVIGGHQRLEAARAEGMTEAPVVFVPGLSDDRAALLNVALNKIAGEFDWSKLGDLFGELDTGDVDLTLSGFDMDEIADLMAGLDETSGDITEDEIPETPKKAISKTGDLWLLGDHRLLCGDSTKAEDVERVMGGVKADLCLTDPPYNVDVDYGDEARGDRSQVEYRAFSVQWFEWMCKVSATVVFTPGTGRGLGHPNLQMWCGIQWPDWILAWVKTNSMVHSSLGGFNNWEPVFVYGKPTQKVPQDIYDIPITVQSDLSDGKGGKLHPVPKQVKFFAAVIEDFTAGSDVVVDPFSGSGTTIIAAEQLGRKCYAIEIEPLYVDVAVKRWENLTGEKAVLDTGEKRRTA